MFDKLYHIKGSVCRVKGARVSSIELKESLGGGGGTLPRFPGICLPSGLIILFSLMLMKYHNVSQ